MLSSAQYAVIHNPPEGQEGAGSESLLCQFEDAVDKQFCVIVVEPPGLGNDCIKWIKLGNFLHKSSVLTTFGFLVSIPFVPTKYALVSTVPIGLFGAFCAGVYSLSWQFDPCCKYQVDYRGQMLARIPSQDIQSSNPIVLVRKNDKYRKILQNTLSVLVWGYVGYLVYKHYRS